MRLPKFLVGLLIGGLFSIIFWYWQKSTSAEDGALSVLDRLAASEARVRELEARLRVASAQPVTSPDSRDPTVNNAAPVNASISQVDDLQQIDGIGPTFSQRLHEAGINSFADLAGQTPAQLVAAGAARSEETAASWINAAQEQLNE